MTNFAVGNNRTPELSCKDKALRIKSDSDVPIIPTKTTANLVERVPLKDTFLQEKAPVKEKRNKTRNIFLTVGGLVLTAASLYIFRGKIKNILSKFTGKPLASDNNISERILANGKKVQRIVENTEGGTKKVVMNVFDKAGNLVLSKEKVITRSVNSANGKSYINIKNTYNAPDNATVKIEKIDFDFYKKMSVEENKYYDTEGKLLLKTCMTNDGVFPCKERRLFDANSEALFATVTRYDTDNGNIICRKDRFSFKNPGSNAVKQTFNEFSEKGTVIKPKNS